MKWVMYEKEGTIERRIILDRRMKHETDFEEIS
jgi:hypothetical protein